MTLDTPLNEPQLDHILGEELQEEDNGRLCVPYRITTSLEQVGDIAVSCLSRTRTCYEQLHTLYHTYIDHNSHLLYYSILIYIVIYSTV